MSTSPYSKDLRKKVIVYLEKGNSQQVASEVFSLHRNTVGRWWKRYKSEGTVCARKRIGAKGRLDIKGLGEFVEANPNSRLVDMSKKFKVSCAWLSIVLRKLGFSYKKKPLPTWKKMRSRELNI